MQLNFIFIWALIPTCLGMGAPWSAQDQDIIYEKVKYVAINGKRVVKEYTQLHPGYTFINVTTINPMKILRLGFHDCLPYSDAGQGEINGCDGCLNPTGMNMSYTKENGFGKGSRNGPDVNVTDNNGLTNTADILEEVFTNPNFPTGPPPLDMSMKDKGMSRADLWAFASLVAFRLGVSNNNYACQGPEVAKEKVKAGPRGRICGHLREHEPECEISWPRMPKFKTGRSDCIPSPVAEKPWHAPHHEIHPRPHGNGPETVDFYRDNFGLNAKEAIALNLGAHSFAKFNEPISQFRYDWTRHQTGLFNNQVLRNVAMKQQYFTECIFGNKWKMLWYGDAEGNKANTFWGVGTGLFTKNKGPWHWFHLYERCPYTNDCAAINDGNNDPLNRKDPDDTSHCCVDLEPGKQCRPECVQLIRKDETALSSDVGMYMKFQVSPEGRPMGCEGMADWKGGFSGNVTCPKEDYAPEGVPLFELVEEMADDQQEFMKVYIDAHEKMIANGYNDADLIEAPSDKWFHDW